MNNVLDLTAYDLATEADFLFQLTKAFDSGQAIEQAKVTANTATMLTLSTMVTRMGTADTLTTEGLWYISPFGYVEITPIPKVTINQVSIND